MNPLDRFGNPAREAFAEHCADRFTLRRVGPLHDAPDGFVIFGLRGEERELAREHVRERLAKLRGARAPSAPRS